MLFLSLIEKNIYKMYDINRLELEVEETIISKQGKTMTGQFREKSDLENREELHERR